MKIKKIALLLVLTVLVTILTACVQKKEFTLFLNGGQYENNKVEILSLKRKMPYPLLQPSKKADNNKDYEFLGWFDSEVGGNPITTMTSNLDKAYARWSDKKVSYKGSYPQSLVKSDELKEELLKVKKIHSEYSKSIVTNNNTTIKETFNYINYNGSKFAVLGRVRHKNFYKFEKVKWLQKNNVFFTEKAIEISAFDSVKKESLKYENSYLFKYINNGIKPILNSNKSFENIDLCVLKRSELEEEGPYKLSIEDRKFTPTDFALARASKYKGNFCPEKIEFSDAYWISDPIPYGVMENGEFSMYYVFASVGVRLFYLSQ